MFNTQNREEDLKLILRRFDKFVQDIENLYPIAKRDKEWLNSKEVCQLLKIDNCTLLRYRTNGLIAHSRIMNKCYYKISDIEIFIARLYKPKKNG